MKLRIFSFKAISLLLVVSFLVAASLLVIFGNAKQTVSPALVIKNTTIKQTSAAVAGRAVNYTALVSLDSITKDQHFVQLPKGANVIDVKQILAQEAGQIQSKMAPTAKDSLTLQERQQLVSATPKTKGAVAKFTDAFYASLETIFSRVVQQTSFLDVSKFALASTPDTSEKFLQIDYQLPAPQITQQDISKGKEVTISAADEDAQHPLTDVLAYAAIPEIFSVGQENKIQIDWQNNGNEKMPFQAFDLNNNGKLDYIEWTVPHLSTQTFDIIYISNALQLDQNRQIIKDISDLVGAKDGNYASLQNGQYIKVAFQKPLTNKNDITLYAKAITKSKIEVYTENSLYPVATFNNIQSENRYKILLTGLAAPTDIFYLKIIGDVDIDYIVDPAITILKNFNAPEGVDPYSSLIADGSTLYGMTYDGGNSLLGTIFSVQSDGSNLTVLHSFTGSLIGGPGFVVNTQADGEQPYGSLVLSGSTLYGMTVKGGNSNDGVIFSINTDGSNYTILHNFTESVSDGGSPYGSLIISGSTLYGMTAYGGTADSGVVFSISTSGSSFNLLHSFTCAGVDGCVPYGSLILSGSTLYGMTAYGGSAGLGDVFSLTTDGVTFASLHDFTGGSDGSDHDFYDKSLVLSGSTLYGMTAFGGSSNDGTIFSVGTDGSGYVLLHTFTGGATDGRNPYGSLALTGSTLFGMSFYGGNAGGNGTIFSIDVSGSGFALAHSFAGSPGDAQTNYGSLVLSGSTFYGMSFGGGTDDEGAIFSIANDGSGYALLTSLKRKVSLDGSDPYDGLLLVGSTFYGVTPVGGSFGGGVLFSIGTDGSGYTVLHHFSHTGSSDGARPNGPLILSGSTLYGTTDDGGSAGYGVIYSIDVSGSGYTVLHTFDNGVNFNKGYAPHGGLVLSSSILYGTTSRGGTSDKGVIFSMNVSGASYTVLHTFTSDGGFPQASLILSGSVLYGTSEGNIYSINTNGSSYTSLHTFTGGPGDGSGVWGAPVLSGSTLYGMSQNGGTGGYGTIFSVGTDGSGYAILHNFVADVTDGGLPLGSLTVSGSTLYGMARTGGCTGYGVIFSIHTDGTAFTLVHSFAGPTLDGSTPYAGFLNLISTTLYGATYLGGNLDGGTIFSIASTALSSCGGGGGGNTAPTFTSISNTSGYIKSGNNVTFTTVASDPDSGDTITLFVCKANDFTGTACGGGGTWCSSSPATTTNPTCNYTVLSGDVDGSHTYYANIIDSSLGASSNPISHTFNTDVTNPTVNAGADQTKNAQFTQDATVSDATSLVASYQWVKTSGPGTITFGTATTEDTTLSADTDGTYVITLTATDNAGNSASDAFTLVWDTTPPTVDAGGDKTTTTQITQVGAVSDATSGMANQVWSKVSGPGTITFGSPTATTTTISANTDGTYTIQLSATDVAGNSASDTFTLIWSTPTVPVDNSGGHGSGASGSVGGGSRTNNDGNNNGGENPSASPIATGSITIFVTAKNGNTTFSFDQSGASQSNFDITTTNGAGSYKQDSLAPGTYSVNQTLPSGWTQTATTCNSIIVAAGTSAVCFITNANNIPSAGGSMTPVISTISSSLALAGSGSGSYQLIIIGSGFTPESVIKFNGSVLPTTYISPTKLKVLILASDLSAACLPLASASLPAAIAQIPKAPPPPAKPQSLFGDLIGFLALLPQVQVAAKLLAAAGLVLGVLPLIVGSLGSPARLISIFSVAFGLKKRSQPWGTVYDSQTKQPIDPAVVTLIELQGGEGREVASVITDLDGRFGFLVEPGMYTINVRKTNYVFPSQKLAGKTQDELYDNLYFGQTVEVTQAGQTIIKNIPMDAVKFDWNEFAKRNKGLMGFYSRWDLLWRRLSDVFFALGFVAAIVAFFTAPYPYNEVILAFYLLTLFFRLVGFKPKTFGYVVSSGAPLSFAIIRVMLPDSKIEVAHKVCDKYGRYYCLVPKGTYYVTIENKNSDGSYSLVYTSGIIDATRSGIIRETFKV